MALLDVKNLTKNFGGLTAVSDVTLELNEGELVGLIGPNGAGKTTLFNLLTGVYEPSEGTVTLDGQGTQWPSSSGEPSASSSALAWLLPSWSAFLAASSALAGSALSAFLGTVTLGIWAVMVFPLGSETTRR